MVTSTLDDVQLELEPSYVKVPVNTAFHWETLLPS